MLVVSSATPPTTSGEGGSLAYVGWGGDGQTAVEQAWLTPYSTESGVKVVPDQPTDYARIQQMVEAGNVTWDVAQVGADFGLDTSDVLEPIDCTIVPCSDFTTDGFTAKKYGVPEMIFSAVIAYNTKAFSADTAPQSWKDFFDAKNFPGKRAILKEPAGGMNGIIEAALLADGVPSDKLYPLDVERALKKLDTIRTDTVFYETNQQCVELLRDGEAAMGNCLNGRVSNFQDQGAPIAISWDGQILFGDYLVVPKGSKNVAGAMKVIAYITSAQHNADLSTYIPYGPANPLAADKVTGKNKDRVPSAHYSDGSGPVASDQSWWTKNIDTFNVTWTQWLTK